MIEQIVKNRKQCSYSKYELEKKRVRESQISAITSIKLQKIEQQFS